MTKIQQCTKTQNTDKFHKKYDFTRVFSCYVLLVKSYPRLLDMNDMQFLLTIGNVHINQKAYTRT